MARQHGSLQSYLKTHGKNMNLNIKVQMALDIAKGMAHLMTYQYVHRDLAARNVLVELDMTCMVSDFGLSRLVQKSANNDSQGDGDEYYASKVVFIFGLTVVLQGFPTHPVFLLYPLLTCQLSLSLSLSLSHSLSHTHTHTHTHARARTPLAMLERKVSCALDSTRGD